MRSRNVSTRCNSNTNSAFGSAQWEGFRTQIDLRWREFRKQHPEIRGPVLWQSLRNILAELGADWATQDRRLGSDFAEGVFFDMTGTCEAAWKLTQ